MSSSATFIKFRVNSAEQFKESVSEPSPNTNLYLTYGKIDPWANDPTPDIANTSIATEYQVWSNMIGGKKILGYDMSHVVPRNNWVANTQYTEYDHRRTDLYDANTKFFIVTKDYNVYKCINNNNNSPSLVEPTSINFGSTVETSDGYVWKYMYTVPDSDQLRFVTSSFIPVKTLPADDGSLQWKVQENARDGAIFHIKVENGGSGYVDANTVSVTITGDGTGATARARVNTASNTISGITMTGYGQNYTFATASISDGSGGTGAIVTPIISPPGGHGSNPLYELAGSSVMINSYLRSSEGGKLPVDNDIRQIALLKDPTLRVGSSLSSNLVFLQATALTVVGSGNYQQDEIVFQGNTPATASYQAKVVSWDEANNVLLVINTVGTPTSQSLIGSTSTTSRFVREITPNYLKPYSGQLLYVSNLEPITRSEDQTEDFKIVLKF